MCVRVNVVRSSLEQNEGGRRPKPTPSIQTVDELLNRLLGKRIPVCTGRNPALNVDGATIEGASRILGRTGRRCSELHRVVQGAEVGLRVG